MARKNILSDLTADVEAAAERPAEQVPLGRPVSSFAARRGC
jgi:hypothetical protein